MFAGKNAPIWFQSMDRNNDGDVSRLEFLGGEERFNTLDANGDGLIDAEEAAAAK
jgi:Ca2+-binding EF-hand superfamily protein